MAFLDLFVCPAAGSALRVGLTEGTADRPVAGTLKAPEGQTYEVTDEVLVFVPPTPEILAQWEQDRHRAAEFDDFERDYRSSKSLADLAAMDQAHDALVVAIRETVAAGPQAPGDVLAQPLVVDVSAGRGTLARRFHAEPFDGLFVAVDLSRAIVEWLRDRLRRDFSGAPRCRYVVSDSRLLPFREGVVPVFATNLGLQHVLDASLTLKGVARMLVPGGAFVVNFCWVDEDSASFELAAKYRIDEFATRDRSLAAFEAAGLAVERVIDAASGTTNGNPFDALPVPGDHYAFGVVIARRPA